MKKYDFNWKNIIKYGALAAYILCALVLIVESLLPGKVSGAHSDKFGNLLDVSVDKIVKPSNLKIAHANGEPLCADVFMGQSLTLLPCFEPKNTTFKQVEWIIDGDAEIQDDVITFNKEGVVSIKAVSLMDDNISDAFTFNVSKAPPANVKINAPASISAGSTAIISATFIPFYSKCDYHFETDSDCISIDGFEITALKEGTADIYAIADGKTLATTEIKINDVDYKFEFKRGDEIITELSSYVGDKVKINCLLTPIGTYRDIIWRSDLPLKFIAGEEFYITPVKSGNFTVTATVDNVDYSLSVTVQGKKLSENVTDLVASDLNMYKGELRSLDLTMTDGDSPAYSAPSITSDSKILSIDSVGRIYASDIGTATVTVEANGISTTAKVTVTKPSVSDLNIIKPHIEPKLNESYPLSCSFLPVFSESEILWQSDDEKTAVVKENGVVEFLKAGKATITASSGGKTASIELYAFNILEVEKVVSDGFNEFDTGGEVYKATMPLNSSARIALVYGKNASYFDYNLSSSDEKILGVADNTITARKTGKAAITIEYSDGFSSGGANYTIEVEVVKQRLSDTVTNWSKTIRKGFGHFAAFLITGVFASVAFMMLFRRKYIALPIVLGSGFFLAGLTELLQAFTPNRGAAFADVLLDFQGFCFAAIPIMLTFMIVYIVKIVRNKKRISK